MMNDQAMFAMGLPGGMRERLDDDALDDAVVRENSPFGAAAPEIAPEIAIAPASDGDLDKVVFELKAAASAARSARKTNPDDRDDKTAAEELPLEDVELGVVPQAGFLDRGTVRAGKRLSAATLVSLLIHSAAFAFALHVARVLPEAPMEEGNTVVSVIMVGNGDVDAAASGAEPTMVEAEPVPVETATAVEAEPLETTAAEPLPPQPPVPVEQAAPTPVETLAPPQTETAVPVTAEPVVAQPSVPAVLAAAPTTALAPSTVPPAPPVVEQAVSPAETPAAAPVVAEALPPQETPVNAPAETAEPLTAQTEPAETIKAQEDDPELAYDIDAPVPAPSPWKTEPLPADQVATRKAEERAKPKPVEQRQVVKRSSAGSSGQSNRDARKGVASGTANTGASQAAEARAGNSGNGEAEMANYAGRLRAKLRRSVASERYYRGVGRLQSTVVVNVRLNRSGAIAGLSLGSSSGNSKVDAIVLQRARAAGPFGAFPASYRGASHNFSLPIQLNLGR
ncbi:TonB family protein [Martelella mediterranea]|uniref:TonB family protein n=1 Tax=Martelella mediterranea TaxID=293089 RepID=UPI001E3CB135|nr:TonB family protein [Martelella mediterranea]MCD1634662.1 TonB family protein [Martelella mediterranea]